MTYKKTGANTVTHKTTCMTETLVQIIWLQI